MFWGVAIQRDVQMLEYYEITIPGARDLHREIPNPNLELSSRSICSDECIH
jgi:hypothetical protein